MTDALICATANGTAKFPALSHSNARALRYDDLSRVLVDLESRAHVVGGSKRDRKRRTASAEPAEVAELRASVATLKAENERVIDRIAEDLDLLADRLAGLEARVRRPFWQRIFGHPAAQPERDERARQHLRGKLRSAVLRREEPDNRSALGDP